MTELLIFATLFILFGILVLAKPDLMWRWQQNANASRGLESKRTEKWEESRLSIGCLSLLFGVIMILMMISRILPSY